MKHIFTIFLISSVIYLSSCGNGANDPLPKTAVADSFSDGSYLSIWFLSDTFYIHDLTLNGVATVAMHASDIYNANDSMWQCHVQLIDAPRNQMALNVTAYGSSSTGIFTVTDNSSTLTDYSHGENKTYSIGIGSVISITSNQYPIKGTMNLTLNYNYTTTYANDSFKINQ